MRWQSRININSRTLRSKLILGRNKEHKGHCIASYLRSLSGMQYIVEPEQEDSSIKDMRSRASSQTVTIFSDPDVSSKPSSGILSLMCRRVKPITWIILILALIAFYLLVLKKPQPTVQSLASSYQTDKGNAENEHDASKENKHHAPKPNMLHAPKANKGHVPVKNEDFVVHVPNKKEQAEAEAAADEVKQYAAFKKKHGVHAIPPLKSPSGEGKGKPVHRYGPPKPKEFPVDILLEPMLHQCTIENQPGVIILVDSQPGNAEYRNAIRNSWGKPENHKGENRDQLEWQVIFLVGTSDEFNADLKEENVEHHDILQGDFPDTPLEQTRKFMMSSKWLATNIDDCAPRFVLISRDDMFINFDAIQEWMNKNFPDPYELYMGRVIRRDVPTRQRNDPMYVSEEDYPSDTFPDLVAGPLYLFSYDVIALMGYSVGDVTPIAQADAYIGILASAINIKPFDNTHFSLLFKPSFKCFLIGLFFVRCTTPDEHIDIFRTIHKARYSYECAGVHGIKIPQAHNDLLKFGKIKQNGEL